MHILFLISSHSLKNRHVCTCQIATDVSIVPDVDVQLCEINRKYNLKKLADVIFVKGNFWEGYLNNTSIFRIIKYYTTQTSLSCFRYI